MEARHERRERQADRRAHPNSRFTAPFDAMPSACRSRRRTTRACRFRRSFSAAGGPALAPLVYQSFDWEHGVFVGATMASERTAAQFGKLGEVRRDPMAMLPFCGYHMGDYFHHWLAMGRRMARPPKIFHVNWFRTDENGKFLWPGYGENLRVIEWILDRCRGEADAAKTPIGFVPAAGSLDLTGLDVPQRRSTSCSRSIRGDWLAESERIESFFRRFGVRLPSLLWDQLERLRQKLRPPVERLLPGSQVRQPAAELNQTIERENPHVFAMLSEFGRRLYFPKGILAQSAEAKEKAKRYDATIGIAREGGQADVPAVGDAVFQRVDARRSGYLRPGDRPGRFPPGMARRIDSQEPQPGGQEVFAAHGHRRRDPRPERRGRSVRRSRRRGARARQVLGKLRTHIRRPSRGPIGHLSVFQRRGPIQRRGPSPGAGGLRGQLARRS